MKTKMTPEQYYEHSVNNAREQEEKRNNAWNTVECKNMYNRLIEMAEQVTRVRSGMKGRAKQIAITAFLRNQEPDYNEFIKDVEFANKDIR